MADMQFDLPDIQAFVASTRAVVEKLGGTQKLFEIVGNDAPAFTKALSEQKGVFRFNFGKFLIDAEFRNKLLSHVPDEADKNYLLGLCQGFDLWRQFEPDAFQWIQITTLENPRETLTASIPDTVNDLLNATGNMYLDTYTETLRVKALWRFINPNKDLGGPGGLVVVSTAANMISTANMILASLVLTDQEAKLLRLSELPAVKDLLMKRLESLEKRVSLLRKQFSPG